MFYGRARRIELAKKAIIVIVALIFLIIAVVSIFKNVQKSGKEEEFSLLKDYFARNGYICEMIQKSGGKCYSETPTSYKSFTRYDDGFLYLVKHNGYSIQVRYLEDTYNDIILETNGNALSNLTYRKFYCYTKDKINGELDYCETDDGEILKAETYIGALESTLLDLNNILNSSGYDVDKLINDYRWKK